MGTGERRGYAASGGALGKIRGVSRTAVFERRIGRSLETAAGSCAGHSQMKTQS